MKGFADFFTRVTGMSGDTQLRLLATLAILLVIWVIRALSLRIVKKVTDDPRVRYSWRKGVSYTTAVLGIILIGSLWLRGLNTLATYLGLLSAGIAIALKEPLTNIAGWIFIVTKRPFSIGDRIETAGFSGDVIDIRVFQFTLVETGNWVDADQSTGRIIDINNGRIFSDPVANYTKGFKYIWNEVPVTVTFESDWRKAKTILSEIASAVSENLTPSAERSLRKANERFLIFYKQLTPIVYTKVADHGVTLTMRYLCEPRKRRNTEETVWESVLDSFEKEKEIELAYPTTRYFTQK